ncbi:MAG: DUF4340 domain-containing protein [Candidatus Aminicenantes bacterium]|nr:MAG: DUF4340 domain-containing protein [Candidatus Aminicenantes bacterium]
MKFKTTLILFAAFIVLLAFILLFEFKGNGEKDEEAKLVSLSSDDITKIIFKKPEETLTFEKNEEGEWHIKEPLEAKADKYEVDRLADDFSDLRIERVVEEMPEELKKYEIPQKEISLYFKDKEKPIKILIGMENPLDNTFFAKRDDEEKVVLISGQLKSLMEKKLFDFRKKDIFKFETDDVKNIKLRAKKIQWEAQKKEEEWFFKKPAGALVKSSQINDILSSLSNLKAKNFVSEDKTQEEIKKYRLDTSEYQITLSIPLENQEVIFSLQKEEDKVYATSSLSSKIVQTEDSVLSDLEKETEELREKKVSDFYSWEAKKIRLKKGGIDITVAKGEEDKWFFENPLKEEADKNKIETFIRKIESLEADELFDPPLDLKDHGLDEPQAEIKIWTEEDEGKTKEITVYIGSEDEEAKKVVVKNARFDYLFQVDSAFLEEFPKELKDWKLQEKKEKERETS